MKSSQPIRTPWATIAGTRVVHNVATASGIVADPHRPQGCASLLFEVRLEIEGENDVGSSDSVVVDVALLCGACA